MKKNISITLLVILVVPMLMMVNCGSPSASEPTPVPTEHPGKAIVASRCVGCHALNKIEQVRFNERGWTLLVDNMVSYGAQLSEEQKLLAVDYLVQTYPKE